MAIRADISHLEGPSDDEDNTVETGWCVNPIAQYRSAESSIADYISPQDHNNTSSSRFASKHLKPRIFDGDDDIDSFQIAVSDFSATARPFSSSSSPNHYTYLSDTSRSQISVRTAASCGLSYQNTISDDLNIHEIMFSITCPDNTTVTVPPNHAKETPLSYMADTESAHNVIPYDLLDSNEDTEYAGQYNDEADSYDDDEEAYDIHDEGNGLDIDDGDIFRLLFSVDVLKITMKDNAQLFFSGIEQEEFDRLLADMADASTETQSDDGVANPAEIHSFRIEVDYREASLKDVQGLDSTYGSDNDSIDYESSTGPATPQQNKGDIEVNNSRSKFAMVDLEDDDLDVRHFAVQDTFDDFDSEVDTPLSHFQPFPIGPFAPDYPSNHLLCNQSPTKENRHPLPILVHNPRTNTLKLTFTIDENWNCPVFELFREDIVPLTGCPVLLSRRVYELQGYMRENRRDERAFRRFMRGRRRMESPLSEEWDMEHGEEDDKDVWVGGMR